MVFLVTTALVLVGLAHRAGAARTTPEHQQIALLTQPHPGIEDECGGLDADGGAGAAYHWCAGALPRLPEGAPKKRNAKWVCQPNCPTTVVEGHSYGIFTWDWWSRKLANHYNVHTKLYDCFETAPFASDSVHSNYSTAYEREDVCLGNSDGMRRTAGWIQKEGAVVTKDRQFHTIQPMLSKQKPLGIYMKWDIEGSEWEVLETMTAKDHSKILMFDLEIHWCLPNSGPLKRVLHMLSKLRQYYRVTGRSANWYNSQEHVVDGNWTEAGCGPGRYDMMSISYVNKHFW